MLLGCKSNPFCAVKAMLFEGNCKPFANDLKGIYEKKVYYFESNKPLFEVWYHQESNRGHKDFSVLCSTN